MKFTENIYSDAEITSESESEGRCNIKPFINMTEAYYYSEEDLVNEIEENYSVDFDQYVEETVDEAYKAPLFDGKARLTARMRLPAKSFDIWAEVSAVCQNGTLLTASGVRDHLWLGFVKEKGVLIWDAGSGPLELKSGKVRTDGRTKISARRYKKDAMLRVGTGSARGTAQGRMKSLDVDPYIHVGHAPENDLRIPGSTSVPGFIGCIHRLRMNGRDVIPPSRGISVTAHGVLPCIAGNLAKLVCP